MNADDHLRQKLSALKVPEPDPAARDRALADALRELRVTRPAGSTFRPPRHSFPSLGRWTLAAGAGVIVLGVVLAVAATIHRTTVERSSKLTAESALLSQMEGLFGTQLDAVVESPGNAPDIRLAAEPASRLQPSLAQPVLIQFRRAGSDGATHVLSYSGRTVCVNLNGRRLCFEPLVTGRNEVLLSGETFCWLPGQTSIGWNGYQVSARPLPPS